MSPTVRTSTPVKMTKTLKATMAMSGAGTALVISGKPYWYLREMARVDGKPKMISQRYLGKASDIEAAMDGAMAVPERTRHPLGVAR